MTIYIQINIFFFLCMFANSMGKVLWIIYVSFPLDFFFFNLIKNLLAKALISINTKYSSGIAAVVCGPSWNTLK